MKTKGRLLVVDDEKDIALYLKQLLDDEGYLTVSAFSGQEALTIIESQKIDIMITDIRMPKMDGITLLNNVSKLKKIFWPSFSPGTAILIRPLRR